MTEACQHEFRADNRHDEYCIKCHRYRDSLERDNPPKTGATMTEDQINHMVNRFLQWRLPPDFNPDGGISFKRTYNEHLNPPSSHQPVGTNLLTATQAKAMILYMLEGIGHG